MYIRKELITPEIANRMLSNNYRNRSLRLDRVNLLAKAMMNDEFIEDSPNTISIDTYGRLIDGQHRLSAIVKSGKSYNLFVARDVPSNSIIDRGLSRSVQDSLYMRGKIDLDFTKNEPMALVRYYLAVIMDYSNIINVKDYEIVDFINGWKHYIKEALRISHIGNFTSGGGTVIRKSQYQAAILGALVKDVPANRLERFSYVVNTGFAENLNETSAIVIRNYIIGANKSKFGLYEKKESTKICECGIKDFVAGVPRKRIYTNATHVYIDPLPSAPNDK